MIRINTSLLFALALVVFCAPLAQATTITAASCSASDVQTAINSSSSGDTVLVPPSSCPSGVTWGTLITIPNTKNITLNGQGVTVNWAGSGVTGTGSLLVINAGATANTIITGFTFNGAFINGACPIRINTTFSPLTQTFRFHDNVLNYASGSAAGTMICINGNGPGLLDHNTFTTGQAASELIHNYGEGAGNSTSWGEDVIPGGPNAIFLEDNTFTYKAGGNPAMYYGTTAIMNDTGSRVVFRFNHLTMIQVDVHGTQPGSGACTVTNGRWWEIYNNDFHTAGTNPNLSNYMSIRGGSGVIFNNTHPSTESNGGAGNINITSDCIGGTYPVLNQVGRGINQNASPAYTWANTIPISSGSSFVQLNRDYFDSTTRPSNLTRCQSAADVSAGCGTAGVSYSYTPYRYPHPLVAGATSGASPAAPTGLTAAVQ